VGGLHRIRSGLGGLLAISLALALTPAGADALPQGFSDRVVYRGLDAPTAIAIAPHGVRFVGEKDGVIVRYDGPGDTTPRMVADLSDKVMSAYDRGLEAIALDPGYPERPYLYASYTYDGSIGGPFPKWGTAGSGREDRCVPATGPNPPPDPGLEDGCQVSGRVAQLRLNGRGIVDSENVILEDWCQQFTSHSMGGIAFDRSGALLVGGGEGASFDHTDEGDLGTPQNRCSDPAGQGGALRAQDLVTPADPVGLSGTVVRVDPDTGAPLPDNPSLAPGNDGRIVAFGLRNPFRIAFRPHTDELWIGDVGWQGFEEVNQTTLDQRRDFGWPCYEGPAPQPNYAAEDPPICDALYEGKVPVASPWFSYQHNKPAVPRDPCFPSEGALSGLAFDSSRDFPLPYDGAMFVSDYVRGCIWSFLPGRDGAPVRSSAHAFDANAPVPVDLVSAPDGLYYADVWGGTVHRISFDGATAEVNAVSRPRGAPIALGGRLLDGAPLTLRTDTSYRVAAPRTLVKGKRKLFFHHWSDHGRRIHRIQPGRDMKLRAVYRKR
jgi:glucose/arabinose dehydrogenase